MKKSIFSRRWDAFTNRYHVNICLAQINGYREKKCQTWIITMGKL